MTEKGILLLLLGGFLAITTIAGISLLLILPVLILILYCGSGL
jgi:hypothetical protein